MCVNEEGLARRADRLSLSWKGARALRGKQVGNADAVAKIKANATSKKFC